MNKSKEILKCLFFKHFRQMQIKPITKKRRKIIFTCKNAPLHVQNLIRSTSTSYKGLLPDLSWRLFRRIGGVTSTTLTSIVYYFKYDTKVIDGDDISTQFSRMIEMEFRESQHLIHHSIIWPTQIIFDQLFFSLPGKIFLQEE